MTCDPFHILLADFELSAPLLVKPREWYNHMFVQSDPEQHCSLKESQAWFKLFSCVVLWEESKDCFIFSDKDKALAWQPVLKKSLEIDMIQGQTPQQSVCATL